MVGEYYFFSYNYAWSRRSYTLGSVVLNPGVDVNPVTQNVHRKEKKNKKIINFFK